MTLRAVTAVVIALIGGAAAFVAAAASWWETSTELYATLDASLATQTRLVSGGPDRDQLTPAEIENISGPDECPPDAVLTLADSVMITRPDGTHDTCLGNPTLPPPPLTDTSADPGNNDAITGPFTLTHGGVIYRVAQSPFHAGGTLQIARATTETTTTLHHLRVRLFATAAAVTAAAALAAFFAAGALTCPMRRLRDTCVHILHTRDYAHPVPTGGPQEVRQLADSFADLLGSLAASLDQQRRLVADAGHELRTPLTSLSLNAELLARWDELDPATRADTAAALGTDVTELRTLVTMLVDLASDPEHDEPTSTVNLADLTEHVAGRARHRTNTPITVIATGHTDVVGQPVALDRAVSNLLDNALEHAPDATRITVTVAHNIIEVSDDGPGFGTTDPSRVFDRFYRGDQARTGTGSGLGMAIVRHVAERHGGAAWATERRGGGATVGFSVGPAQHSSPTDSSPEPNSGPA